MDKLHKKLIEILDSEKNLRDKMDRVINILSHDKNYSKLIRFIKDEMDGYNRITHPGHFKGILNPNVNKFKEYRNRKLPIIIITSVQVFVDGEHSWGASYRETPISHYEYCFFFGFDDILKMNEHKTKIEQYSLSNLIM